MTNRFAITITAVDKFSQIGKKIGKSLETMLKPIAKIGAEAGFRSFSSGASKLASVIEELGISGRFLSGGLIGVAGLAAGAGAGIGKLTLNAADLAMKTQLMSARIGVGAEQLQALSLAQKVAGGSGEALQSGLQSLGDTMEDALYGRNQQALALMNRLGIQMHRTEDGALDVEQGFYDIADAIARSANPQVQALIAKIFGLEAALPLLRKGSEGVKAAMADVTQSGAVQSQQQLDQLQETYAAWQRLGLIIDGVKNKIANVFAPDVTKSLNGLGDTIENTVKGRSDNDPIATVNRMVLGIDQAAKGSPAPAPKSKFMPPAVSQLAAKASSMASNMTMGLRNNNPGNLRRWGGMPSPGGYAVFPTMGGGLNALAQQLLLYADRDHLNTLSGVIDKFAPAKDHNNTAAYKADLARRMGKNPDEALNLHDPATLSALMNGLIGHENKNYAFPADLIDSIARARIAADKNVPSLYGGRPGATGTKTAADSPPVNVEVNIDHAPPGTKVTVKKPADVTVNTHLGYAMPGPNL